MLTGILFSHRKDKSRIKALSALSLLLLNLILCDNPFFPHTGKPIQSFNPLATPEQTIKQLFKAYESKQYDLYKDLLSDSFQFYVATSFFTSYLNSSNKYNYQCETPDTNLLYVPPNTCYYYWKKKEELESHRKLFSSANTIRFAPEPQILETHYIVDSLQDTVLAEIKTTSNGFINIDVDEGYRILSYTVDIRKQVFLLEKNSEGKWLIKKWFDLSDAPSVIS